MQRIVARVEASANEYRYIGCRRDLTTRNAPKLLSGCVLPKQCHTERRIKILEDASGGGPHVLHEGQRQPTPSCSCHTGAYWLMSSLRQ